MKKISIIISVYKGSEKLDSLLKKLVEEKYKPKEIIIIIDEPDERSLTLYKEFKTKVKFVINKVRKGKVEALNYGIKISNGEILVFLDADVILRVDNFFETIEREIENYDVLDFKKKIIQESFISRMVNHEYLVANIVWYIFSEIIKRPPFFMVGAGFAITKDATRGLNGFRKVIVEDADMAIRIFDNNMKYKFSEKIEIRTESPKDWKVWLKQRKRWSAGVGQYFRLHWKTILKSLIKYPSLHILSLIFFSPFLFLLPFLLFFKVPLLSLTTALFFVIEVMVIYTIIMLIFSKIIGYKFSFIDFILFYFTYLPISAANWIAGITMYFIRRKADIDWVV